MEKDGKKHLTPTLSPFCSADSAKRGEGETLSASADNDIFLITGFLHKTSK